MKLLYLVESGESKFLVFDEMPDKISTKYGDDTIIGRIGGIFYDFLAKRNGRREAFGGRKFDIILDNGKVEKCEGQWWDAVTDRAKEEFDKEEISTHWYFIVGKPESIIDELINLEIGDTNVFYPHIKENRPWDIEEMDWYDLREHANTMSDFIQKLYNYI